MPMSVLTDKTGKSQAITSASNINLLCIIRALNFHKLTGNCCIKLEYTCVKGILVAVTTLDPIVLIVSRLAGVRQPYVSTASGKNKAPLLATASSYLRSFSSSPAAAAEPAEFALLATNFNWTVLQMVRSK